MKEYQFKDNRDKRRYELDLEDGQIAHIDYVVMPSGDVALTHTDVPYVHENKGIGSQIVKKALEDIKQKNAKVVPQCGFVSVFIRRHPEWTELVAMRERTY